MRKAPDYKLIFRTFEALMEFVSIYKIKEYEWEKYNGEYYLSFEPNQEFRKWLRGGSVWDWKEEIKEMREKDKKNK